MFCKKEYKQTKTHYKLLQQEQRTNIQIQWIFLKQTKVWMFEFTPVPEFPHVDASPYPRGYYIAKAIEHKKSR